MVKAVGPYTPAFPAGGFIFCSGQIGLDENNDLVEGLENQIDQAFENLKALLAENNAALTDVVKTTVFLTDMSDYAAMNTLYAEHFGDHKPARSAVAVSALPKGAIVEIEAIVHVG